MYIVFFLLSRPPWKSAIAEGVSVNKYSFNNNNNQKEQFDWSTFAPKARGMFSFYFTYVNC